jgi:DNA polymerase beta
MQYKMIRKLLVEFGGVKKDGKNPNALIIEKFNQLLQQIQAEYLNAQMENNAKEIITHQFRMKNIKKVIDIIRKLDFKITSSHDLRGIPGIGKGSLQRVDEILMTGDLDELKHKYAKKKQEKITSIQELSNVIGIGPKTAKKLVVKYGITGVEDLKKAIKKKEIKVNDNILLGLKYYGVVQGNIPRKEIRTIEQYLKKEVSHVDPELEMTICGSYRREKATSGDIDVLLYHPKLVYTKHVRNPTYYHLQPYLQLLVNRLEDKKFLLDSLTTSDNLVKYMGFYRYNDYPVRRIDIRLIPYQSRFTALLYFTGPGELNEEMRKKAKKRGMLLNEYGLYKEDPDGTLVRIQINSEKEIFEKLGMEYLTPKERESYNTGKITIVK